MRERQTQTERNRQREREREADRDRQTESTREFRCSKSVSKTKSLKPILYISRFTSPLTRTCCSTFLFLSSQSRSGCSNQRSPERVDAPPRYVGHRRMESSRLPARLHGLSTNHNGLSDVRNRADKQLDNYWHVTGEWGVRESLVLKRL